MASLLRLVYLDTGSIKIDGCDITAFKPDDVRARLLVLPQDLVFVPANLRENMNLSAFPSGADVWTSLKATGMAHGYVREDNISQRCSD